MWLSFEEIKYDLSKLNNSPPDESVDLFTYAINSDFYPD